MLVKKGRANFIRREIGSCVEVDGVGEYLFLFHLPDFLKSIA
jgi:hypothetical protein